MKTWSRKRLGILLISFIAISAAGYDHPLDSYSIRDAYFLGTDRERCAQFLTQYVKTFPASNSELHVAQIEVRTPYVQVVVSSREHSVGYSALQAEQDYRKNPDTLQVRVQILFSTGFANRSVALPAPACQGAIRMNSALD